MTLYGHNIGLLHVVHGLPEETIQNPSSTVTTAPLKNRLIG